MTEFSHLNEKGQARMVDVGDKVATHRIARASCRIQMRAETLAKIRDQQIAKGEVLQVARLAGIMAAKQTSNTIPLCHPLPITKAEINFEIEADHQILVQSEVGVTGQTGVEMEALVSVTVAALTIYDMCKGIDRAMTITDVQLDEKSGGHSGHFLREK